jgi:HSP20 family protein
MLNLIPWKKKTPQSNSLVTGSFEKRLDQLRDEFDSLLDRFWVGWPSVDKSWVQRDIGWSFDLDENEKEYVVRAEAPGFEAGDFNVEVRGNYLTISAEHKEEQQDGKNGNSYHYGSFHRTAPLPHGADSEKITASYHSGILELHLPKEPEVQGKRITVQAN